MYKLIAFIFTAMLFCFTRAEAQQVDSIYVHLYTDSLKKGTYNYINIDGLLANGKYLPLDSSQISFTSSYGKFYGNSLWVEANCEEKKIAIHVVLKKNHALQKDFVMYIKQQDERQQLKTEKQLLDELKAERKKKKEN